MSQGKSAAHECETPVDGGIQHRWRCKLCGKVWEVVDFENGKSIYEELENPNE